jgi:hypothetical protein
MGSCNFCKTAAATGTLERAFKNYRNSYRICAACYEKNKEFFRGWRVSVWEYHPDSGTEVKYT